MTQIDPHTKSLPAATQKPFWTVGRKLLIPSVALMALVALGLIIYIATFTVRRNQSEASRDLSRTLSAVQASLKDMEKLSLGLATEIANSPQVQAAFAAKDRKLLTEITLPTFEVVAKEFEVKQFQFIQPPATSFLRLHQLDKFGDDLSSIRFTVLEANATQKPVSGIEIGRGGLGIRGEVPIFYEGKHLGVVDIGLDIGPSYLQKIKQQYGVDVQILLEKGAAEAATFAGVTSEVTGPIPELLLQATTFEKAYFAEPSVYERVLQGETVFSRITPGNKTYSLISTPLKDYSGKVIGVLEISADRTAVVASQSRSLILSILLSLLATALAGVVLVQLINRTVQPINLLTETAVELAGGNLESRAEVNSKDELGTLASAFNRMTDRLREMIGTLEERVAERTHSLELAAEVGRSVSQVRDLDTMLQEAVEIIRTRFNLYYVQVYLANPTQTTLTLRSGTGTVGAELTARGHSLPINTNSINGRAAMEKRPVIISDTAASASFRPNALLPDTRSEMAVPLIINEKVVGVLDMQSDRPGALSQEILPAFDALAGQLAVAIQNANLLEEAKQARAEVEKQAARLSQTHWQDYLDAIHKPEQIGFVYEQNKVTPLSETAILESASNGNSLSAPIAVSGNALGSLVVELGEQPQGQQATELLSAVARQVAQQIENLRLVESAERYRAEAEQASRRLTHEGWNEYIALKSQENLGFRYDLKEVRPNHEGADISSETSAVTLPIKVRDEAIGKLAVEGLSPDDDTSLALVNTVAERLGAHIESLRQYDRTQSALAQSEKLFEASRRLTQATDLQELVRTAVEMLHIPVVNRASLGIFNYNATGELESMTDVANWWNGIGTEAAPIGMSYSAQSLKVLSIFLSDTPVFFNDTFHDERMGEAELQILKRMNIKSLAVLPLILGQHQIGVLRLLAEEPHTFTPEEIRLFSSLAPQIATVLDNRLQFERAQKQAERESMLNTISQKIQSATSVEAVLQIAARELGHALGAPLTIAQLGVKDGK
jgi:GAF domain-containing protein/HAMP domain-containing protein